MKLLNGSATSGQVLQRLIAFANVSKSLNSAKSVGNRCFANSFYFSSFTGNYYHSLTLPARSCMQNSLKLSSNKNGRGTEFASGVFKSNRLLTMALNSTSSVSKTTATATSSDELPHVIFVLGPPGAGKGTICMQMVRDFGLEHLSAGDLLRTEQQTPNSPYGALIDSNIRNGTIVPVEITCSLLERAMQQSKKRYFLIDGFPRNEDNLSGWQRQMSDKTHVEFIIFLECPEETCIRRCLDRSDKCDDGAKRADDNIESLRKRFQTYVNSTMKIVEHYDREGLLRRIDASKSVDKVYDQVKGLFGGVQQGK